jgi:DNA processing protein
MQHDDDRTLGWLGLTFVPGLSARAARTLVERFGSPEAVLAASDEALRNAGVESEALAIGRTAREAACRELERVAAYGARVLDLDHPAYPARLRAIADPPLVLVVRGSLDGEAPAIAIVGARRATAYGKRVAAELATGLAGAGVVVVSGLAAGIDAAAHQATLAAGGSTVAVLGTGIDRVYPRWHGPLTARIAAAGALVTELAVGAPPLQHHFPKRNRILSGLTLGTVVVEAGERSGSLITARLAAEQGREVFAVPGPLGAPLHEGPHRLIQEGAKLVRRVDDVLDEMAPALVGLARRAAAARAAAVLTDDERTVLGALEPDGGHVDAVIARTATAPASVLETLLALELRGLVEQLPGKRFRAAFTMGAVAGGAPAAEAGY